MNSIDYSQEIEEEILKTIEAKLLSQQMDVIRAKQIAQLVLNSLRPGMTLNQIHDIVQKFDDYFPELAPVVNKANQEYNRATEQIIGAYASKLLSEGKTNEAITLIHQTLNKQIKLKI